MKFSLVFENSGDFISFDPVNQELLEFYIDQLNQQSLNRFFSENSCYGQKILDSINQLDSNILEVNNWLNKFTDIQFDSYTTEEYLCQHVLNKIHADWVTSHSLSYDIAGKRKQYNFSGLVENIHEKFPDNIPAPLLSVVLSKLELNDIYDSINVNVHKLEKLFDNIQYTVSESWTIVSNNHFPKSFITNDLANLRLSFNHLGKSLYHKFVNFDLDLKCNDENSYDELLGYLTLSLLPSQTVPLSLEYVDWCKSHNKTPSGGFLNIGNIPNLYENLTKYRIIIFRNLLNNHGFSIHKTKG
jgi:hypothetical protein